MAEGGVAICAGPRVANPSDLYVTSTATADGNCTMDAPCTLPSALARVTVAGGGTINLAASRYVGDIALPPRAQIVGGWQVVDGAWISVCDETVVVLEGETANMTVRAAEAPDTGLALVTVVSAARPALPSESWYGIFVSGSTTSLTLDNVAVATRAGGAGTGGAAGPPLPPGLPPPTCSPGDGAVGPPGNVGASGDHGYGPSGIDARAGSTGAEGAAGSAGTAGGPGETSSGLRCVADGFQCRSVQCSDQAPSGTPGCGALGGKGGAGGESGGGSIAVFAWDGARVVVRGGRLSAGPGGAGGAGGGGGPGAPGFSGAPGASLDSDCFSAGTCGPGPGCGQPTAPKKLAGGSAGGSGGSGGVGGSGGGGAGGPSFAVVTGAGANVSLVGTKMSFGPGGAGGAPNGALGPSGELGP
jgi:hypothetical protein